MKDIVKKYLEGNSTVEEQVMLLEWLRQGKNRSDFHSLKLDWKKGLDNSWFPKEGIGTWNEIQAALLQKSFNRWHKSKKIQLIFNYAAIFFFAVFLSGGAWFLFSSRSPEEVVPVYYTSIIAEKGQISKVELPDGSHVWLNSGSKLTYNNSFAADNRNLSLSGEAFFDVKRNEEIPLIVSCNNLKVKVLGTKFNVSSYRENSTIDVVLEKGSVELSSSESESFNCLMHPGELAQFETENRKLVVSQVNVTKFTSWKDGIINIYNLSLDEVVTRLEMRYNQGFDFDESIKNFHYTFTIKNEPLNEIIQLMEKITPVKAIQKDNVIVFSLDKNKLREAE